MGRRYALVYLEETFDDVPPEHSEPEVVLVELQEHELPVAQEAINQAHEYLSGRRDDRNCYFDLVEVDDQPLDLAGLMAHLDVTKRWFDPLDDEDEEDEPAPAPPGPMKLMGNPGRSMLQDDDDDYDPRG